MSFCVRSISNKVTSLVNTRRQVTQLDHQLYRRIKSSLFLKEFLGMQTKISMAVNCTKPTVNTLIPLLGRNIPVTSCNADIDEQGIWNTKYNYNKKQTPTLHQPKQINIQSLNVINFDQRSILIWKKNRQWLESYLALENKESDLLHTEIKLTSRIFSNVLPNSKMKSNLYSEVSPNTQDVNEKSSEDRKSSETQLQNVFKCLQEDLPALFVKTMDYSIYTPDLIFINNIRGTSTTGLYHYIKQISLLKIIGHLKYAYVSCNILKMTMHPEDNTIKVRWRIEGVSGTNVFLSFWKFNIFNVKDQMNNKPTWYDGFSIFYVNNDGKIFKHVVDKMMPDEEQEKVKTTPVEPKLALFSALLSLDSYYYDKFFLKTHFQLPQIK